MHHRRPLPTLLLSTVLVATVAVGVGCGGEERSTDRPTSTAPPSTTSPGSPSTADPTAAPPTTSATGSPPSTVATTTPPTSPPPTSPTTVAPTMPDVVGLGLQDAQDLIQTRGVFFSRSFDCTGAGRQQILDRNWVVVTQTPAPGAPIAEGEPRLGAVKLDEPRTCV